MQEVKSSTRILYYRSKWNIREH